MDSSQDCTVKFPSVKRTSRGIRRSRRLRCRLSLNWWHVVSSATKVITRGLVSESLLLVGLSLLNLPLEGAVFDRKLHLFQGCHFLDAMRFDTAKVHNLGNVIAGPYPPESVW